MTSRSDPGNQDATISHTPPCTKNERAKTNANEVTKSMQYDEIMLMLENYNTNKGRLDFLKVRLNELIRIHDVLEKETISGEAIHGISADVAGHTGKISRPVENLAIRLADGWMPDSLIACEQSITRTKSEIYHLSNQILYVDRWLGNLTEREKWIIVHKVINAEPWKETMIKFRDKYAECHASKDTLKRLKERAVEKILSMADA